MDSKTSKRTGITFNNRLTLAEDHPAWHRFDEIPASLWQDPEAIFLNLSGGWQQPPVHIRDAGIAAVEEGFLKIQPVPEFNRAVAEKFHNDFDIEIDPVTQVIPSHGSGDGLLAVLSTLLNPGDEVLTFDPAYTLSLVLPAYLGASVKTIPLAGDRNWEPDGDQVIAQLDRLISDRTRLFVLVNPDNPTGHVYRREFLIRLGEKLREHNLLVVEDTVYEKVVYPPAEFTPLLTIPRMRDHTITMSSFAKGYLCAGLKAGYIVAPEAVVEKLRHYYMLSSFTPNTLALRTGVDILRGPHDFLHEWLEQWDEMRQLTVSTLNAIPGVRCHLPEAGTYCLADVSKLGSGDEIAQSLMEKARVLVTPGSYYGEAAANHVRVCYGRTAPEKVREGLERVAACAALRGETGL